MQRLPFILFNILLITKCNNCIIKQISIIDNIQSSAMCISTIADTYFNSSSHINVFTINNYRDINILFVVFNLTKHAVKLRDLKLFKFDFFETSKEYTIVISDTLIELLSYKQKFQQLWLWNARSKYLFVVLKSSQSYLNDIVDILISNNMFNSIIMMPEVNSTEIYRLYSWYPFNNGSCGGNKQILLFDICKYGKFERNYNLYPIKIPKYFNGCPIISKAIIWSPYIMPPEDGIIKNDKEVNVNKGFELIMMRTFAKVLNITLKIYSYEKPQNWGMATANGNMTGMIKDIYEKKLEIGFGNYGATEGRRMFAENSASFIYDSVSFCVPKAEQLPRWRNLLIPFKITTWISMLVAFSIVSLFVWKFCNFAPREDVRIYFSIQNTFQMMFSMFLGFSVSRTPRKSATRMIICVWLVFAFHFVTAYQAKLISVLLSPIYQTQITTIEEVLESGMSWEVIPTLTRVFEDKTDWKVLKILKNWKDCHDADICLKRVALEKNFAIFMSETRAKFEAYKYLDENGQRLIFCIPSYTRYPVEIFLQKGHPLKDRLNELIYRILHTGLLAKWYDDLSYETILKNRHNMASAKSREKLSLEHLQGVFAIWNVCIGLALLCFICEIVYFKIQKCIK